MLWPGPGQGCSLATKGRPLTLNRTSGPGLSLLVSGLIASSAAAQVQWRSPAAPAFGLAGEPDFKPGDATKASAGRHVAIQLTRPPRASDRSLLASAGITLGAPLGGNAFFARVSADAGGSISPAVDALIRHLQPIDPNWKLHPAFAAQDESAWTVVGSTAGAAGRAEPIVIVYALFHADERFDARAAASIDKLGGKVHGVMSTVPGVVLEIPRAAARALANEDFVQWIEPALPLLSPTNAENRALTHANQVQAAPYSLNGAGVTAFVFDGGAVRTTHQDLAGRAAIIDGSGVIDHATHVAGTIAGTGAASGGNNRGMAPGASILSATVSISQSGWLYTNPTDIEADYTNAISQGADIANNSIGTNVNGNGFPCSWHGDYGVTDGVIDAIVRGSQAVSGGAPFRIVWAAGNERGGRCDTGGYRTIGPPAGAKNHLSVGAVNANDDSMTAFSGWGPTDDGRLKPDFCAPGCQNGGDAGVTSCGAGSNTSYTNMCGTSMACPTTTGIGALLMQDWSNLRPGQPWPRNSTMKVILAQSAVDLGNAGPDYRYGYGSIRADAAVDLLRTGAVVERSLDQDFVDYYTLTVAPGTASLTVTAAWDDAPGTPNVIPSLINDLDIRVYGPGGERHYPWTLTPNAPNNPAVRTGEDHLNNIEQVRADAPAAGQWTIEVHGTAVPQGPQPYSIVSSESSFGFTGSVSIQTEPVTLAPEFISPGVPTPTAIRVLISNDTLLPGSPSLHYRADGGSFTTVPMADMGDGLYEASLPAFACGDLPEYYFSISGELLGTFLIPPLGAAAPYSAFVGSRLGSVFDMETAAGWSAGASGDTAHFGQWERGIPQLTLAQPGADHTQDPGVNCWITGRLAGTNADTHDVDGGRTTLLSPVLDLSAADPSMRLGYWRWYSNSTGAAPNLDTFVVDISSDGGSTWTNFEIVGPGGPGTSGGWMYHEARVADFVPLTATVRVRFVASDIGSTSTVEAAIDDVALYWIECDDTCAADFDGSGSADVPDIFAFLAAWFAGLPAAEFDGAEGISVPDIFAYLSIWFAGC